MIQKDEKADGYPSSVNESEWTEITQGAADYCLCYCLCVLPPIYFPGGFAVSEPIRHTLGDEPVYCCVVSLGERWFAREMTIKQASAHVRELRDLI